MPERINEALGGGFVIYVKRDGEYIPLEVDASGAIKVADVAGGGGGGTASVVALDAATLAALETINVGNWPATTPVTGTVNVGNLPATQPVSDGGGSLTVDGTVSVGNFPATQPVSGTVSISNPPASPETGLSKDTTLGAVRDRLPDTLDADGGLKVHVQNPSSGGGGTAVAPATYLVTADAVALAGGKHHLSILNPLASGKVFKLHKLFLTNLQLAAATGVALRFEFRRATAVTGGTALTAQKADTASPDLPAGTALATGATVVNAGLLFPAAFTNDEVGATNAFPTSHQVNGTNLLPEPAGADAFQHIRIRPGEGFTVQQITANTVGSFAWLLVFSVE